MTAANVDRSKKSAEAAGQMFGMALGVLVADMASPEILHSLIDLAVAMRDHDRERKAATDDR